MKKQMKVRKVKRGSKHKSALPWHAESAAGTMSIGETDSPSYLSIMKAAMAIGAGLRTAGKLPQPHDVAKPHCDRSVSQAGNGGTTLAERRLRERARLKADAAYNSRLMAYAEQRHDPLSVLVLERHVARMQAPCNIRTLLDRAEMDDADFIGAVWLIARGRLFVLSPGRLSLATVVENARSGPASRDRIPRPSVPGQREALA